MIEFDITSESKNLLKLMYALYLSRREEGKGRTEANYFGDSQEIQNKYLPNMSVDDVTDLCFELSRAGCIKVSLGDCLANNICLTYDALVYCEQTFQRNIKNLLEWVSSIKGILPL